VRVLIHRRVMIGDYSGLRLHVGELQPTIRILAVIKRPYS